MEARTLKNLVCQSCDSGGMIRHMPCPKEDYDRVDATEDEEKSEGEESGDEEEKGKVKSGDQVEEETERAGHVVHWCEDQEELPNGVQCVSLHDGHEEWWVCSGCKALHVRCVECQKRDDTKIQFCKLVAWCGEENTQRGRTVYRIPTLQLMKKHPTTAGLAAEIVDCFKTEKEYHTKGDAKHEVEWLGEESMPSLVQDLTSLFREQRHTLVDGFRHYCGDQGRYFFGNTDDLITGGSGGFFHTWRCTSCDTSYQFNDK